MLRKDQMARSLHHKHVTYYIIIKKQFAMPLKLCTGYILCPTKAFKTWQINATQIKLDIVFHMYIAST